ncbi:MAG: chemotaxis protein CheY [Acidobacteria bacterium]|nr:chemotaxis protein CheY [Acidobacteriota bacterium]
MTPSRKKQLLRYGITIDLVVLAIGIGWLFPELSLPVVVGIFAVATALAGWRAEWEGIAIAMVLSAAALFFAFNATPVHLAACAIASVILGAIVRLSVGNRAAVLQPASVFPIGEAAGNVVAFDSERSAATQLRAEEERAAEEKRSKAAKAEAKAAREKAAGEKREREAQQRRLEEERAVTEAKAAKERAEAERVAAEKLAAEKREREAQQRRVEEERAATEAKAANERAEAERVAAEKLAAEKREREASQRLEEERVATEVKAAKDRAEAERVAAEKLAAEKREREALQRRLEEERAATEAKLARERADAEARVREEAERLAAEKLAAEKREREALQRRLEEERAATEARIEEAGRIAAARLAEERVAMEARAREDAERAAAERERQLAEERAHAERVIAEKLAAEKSEREALQRQLEQERASAEAAQREREAMERLLHEQRAAVNAARDEAEAQIAARIAEAARDADAERTRERQDLERQLNEQRVAAEELEKQLAREREERSAAVPPPPPAAAPRPYPQRTQVARKPRGIFSTITGWFRKPAADVSPSSVNLKTKKVAGNTTATRRAAAAAPPLAPKRRAARKPRILLLEKRRGTAETIVPKLRHRGIEVQVVERWIDAVDEIFRFRPDAFFLDCELPDFDRVYKAVSEHSPNMPLLLTGRNPSAVPAVRHAQFIMRPYDLDLVIRVAQEAMADPSALLALQTMPARLAKTIDTPAPVSRGASRPAVVEPVTPSVVNNVSNDDGYSVVCSNCRITFDAADADWCSCLTKERTLVCTNCLTCFCKAPPSYKEKFWVQAPPKLFERKSAELRRQEGDIVPNAEPEEVRRPLVELVEDDEDIQVIVQRVCANLGYGFVGAANGQDGLSVARRYRPNLILSDAFMPKLDGREMCRILREEPGGADIKMVVMTGLYTDTKYKSEALKRFHIDDYLSKPVAITDLINLLQRHLEGVAGLPQQEDLHELHRRAVNEHDEHDDNDIPLSQLLDDPNGEEPDFPDVDLAVAQPDHQHQVRSASDSYDVCCFTCNQMFDAARAEWCTCLGRDQTLVCAHCGNCFCRAPSIYKERFWVDAPSSLFERKMIGSKRNVALHGSPDPAELRRPLILLVEDDENIQLIVKTVVTTMGYGFIAGANGQEGLALAREYNPDLILSDAFMPKLDGREMCRLLKEDPSTARAKAIIMTGLYTDRKYRAEALSYFKVDDYVAKPLAVDDLIKLMKKHLPQDVQATM